MTTRNNTATSEAGVRALVDELYAALAARDGSALRRLVAADAQLEASAGMPLGLGRTYRGSEQIRKAFWGQIAQHFDVTAEVAEVQPLADGRVLVLGTYRGRAAATQREVEAGFAHVLRFDGGQLVALTQITDTHQWQAASEVEPQAAARTDTLSTLRLEVDGGLATITLQRPEAHNALNLTTADELLEVATRCSERADIRAVLLRAEGDMFTAGGDLEAFRGLDGDALSSLLRRMIVRYHQAILLLTEMDAPVVAAVRGAAAGGGLGLLFSADVVVAADNTRFALGYGALGLPADGGTSWYLPRLVGMRTAQRMFLLNERLTAEQALAAGLVSELVPDEQVEDRALQLAQRLAAGPTLALGQMRRLLRSSTAQTLSEQLDDEQQAMAAAGRTDDAREGIAAFADRRRAQFFAR